jgi:hypothetical protein
MLVVEDAPETCEAIWRVAARRIDWRAGLFTAVTAAVLAAMFGVMPTPTAGASTIITGDRDSSLSLEIVPASDPITTQVTASSGLTVAFIQRMPVTKTVRRVTLGDLSVGSGCGATALQLFIREHLTGDVDTSSQIAYSADHRSLPGAPGKVTWDIPSTTLLKGRGYSFRLAMPQGCGTFALTNWAADAPPVNAGPARCAQGPMMDPAGTQVRWRMYHVQGVNDAQTPCVTVPPPVPPYFDPTMPTGWLVTSGSYVFTATRWDHEPSASTACEAGPAAAGARVVRWRESPGLPGYYDYVCMWSQSQYGDPDASLAQGWHYGGPWLNARNGQPREAYVKLEPVDCGSRLTRYIPQLRYHYAESYRADSAWTATLPLPPFSGTDPELSNNLERADGTILAAADPGLGYPTFSLATLPGVDSSPELYATGEPALDSDRLDFRDDTYQADADAMHGNASLANKIYGRCVEGDDGKYWLQYWFFYYYNDATYSPPVSGDHEGDWEMVQVGLDAGGSPDVATYAQHSFADSCPWDRVPKYSGPAGDAPVVFVELGSHASLFYAPAASSYDAAFGSERVRPAIETEIGNAGPGWASWRGLWGASATPVTSPGRKGAKWDDPSAYNSSAQSCPIQASGAVTARSTETTYRRSLPPKAVKLARPRIKVHRIGRNRVHIAYRYTPRGWKRLPSKVGLVLAVRGRDARRLPRSVIFRPRKRIGRRTLALPRAMGPYLVSAQTFARPRSDSRPVFARVR